MRTRKPNRSASTQQDTLWQRRAHSRRAGAIDGTRLDRAAVLDNNAERRQPCLEPPLISPFDFTNDTERPNDGQDNRAFPQPKPNKPANKDLLRCWSGRTTTALTAGTRRSGRRYMSYVFASRIHTSFPTTLVAAQERAQASRMFSSAHDASPRHRTGAQFSDRQRQRGNECHPSSPSSRSVTFTRGIPGQNRTPRPGNAGNAAAA